MNGQTDPARPDPDQLLNRLQQEAARARCGKLKIFFGASPGVGKTYAMLQAARRAREQGVDVVVGLVETHGRQETAVLLAGLEQLPLNEVSYRERTLREFDLDAALARRPTCFWSMTWPTATRPAAAIPSAGRTSRNCWMPASMC